MNNFYKDTAMKLYIERIKESVPNIDEYELEMIRSAFVTGFNMGRLNSFSSSAQEMALSIMVR